MSSDLPALHHLATGFTLRRAGLADGATYSAGMTVETGGATSRRRVPPRRRVLRWVLLTMVVLVIATLVAAVLMIRDALTARDALQDAAAQVPAIEQKVRDGLLEGSAPSLTDAPELPALQEQTATARDATDGVLWDLAVHLPEIGPSVDAVQRIAAALDDVAAEVLPALAAVGDAAAAAGRTADGGVDLAPLADVAGQVSAARVAVDAARSSLDEVDPTQIRGELVEPLTTLEARLDELAGLTATAERATSLLRPMVSTGDPRRYPPSPGHWSSRPASSASARPAAARAPRAPSATARRACGRRAPGAPRRSARRRTRRRRPHGWTYPP